MQSRNTRSAYNKTARSGEIPDGCQRQPQRRCSFGRAASCLSNAQRPFYTPFPPLYSKKCAGNGNGRRGGSHMKKIPMILLLLAPYIFLGICLSQGLVSTIPVLWFVLFVCILFPNMVYAFLLPKLKYEGKQLLFLFDYSLLLPSTMYGVSGILNCYRNGKLSKKEAAVHIFAQFMFCFDVFSAIYCYMRVRKSSLRSGRI